MTSGNRLCNTFREHLEIDPEADVTPTLHFSLNSHKPEPGDLIWKQKQEWEIALLPGLQLFTKDLEIAIKQNQNEV